MELDTKSEDSLDFEPPLAYKTPTMAGSNNSLSTFNSDLVYNRRLSSVSKKFDRNNKGYLDETEQALRRLDSQNTGLLDVNKVYGIMDNLQTAQKQNEELLQTLRKESKRNGGLRRGIALLCAFSVLLTMANVGTSFAAARLARDTQVGANGDLESSTTGLRLGTTSKEVTVEMQPLSASRRRRHLEVLGEDEGLMCKSDYMSAEANCTLQGTITQEHAAELYQQLCPSRNAAGQCIEAGISQVNLNCNGHWSTLLGGHLLPDTPPTDFEGYVAYPSDQAGYYARAATRFFGFLYPCVQDFSVAMYCPNATMAELWGDDSCLVFSAWERSCPGDVEICGRYIPEEERII